VTRRFDGDSNRWRGHIAAARSNVLGSLLLDRDLKVVWVSKYLSALFGARDGSLRRLDIVELVHPEDRERVFSMLATELEGNFAGHEAFGQRYTIDVRIQHADGGWLLSEINATNMFDDPEVEGFLVQIMLQSNQHTRLRALLSSARGESIETVLDTLLQSLSTGGEREQSAVIVDTGDRILASVDTPWPVGSTLDRSQIPTSPLADRREWTVPIRHPKTSEALGALIRWDRQTTTHPFDRYNAIDVADVAAVVMERHEFDLRLRVAASTDALTGLVNRATFRESVAEACTYESATPTVVFVDLDRFKEINDTFGHHAGDLVLIELAKRLREAVPAEDVVARLGGDEFAVLTTARSMTIAAAVALVVEVDRSAVLHQ
jgi:hypothetical protein